MDFEYIITFLGSAAGSAVVATVAWTLGRQMGRKQLQECMELLRRRRGEAALETGGELTHWATPTEIDWSKWGPGELATLWRLMERDGLKPVGNPADPDLQMRLIRELDDQQRARAKLQREGARLRENSFEERYRQARQAIEQQEQRSEFDQAAPRASVERVAAISRGRDVLTGVSYVFAFGQLPLTPIGTFDQRLSAAFSRIGSAIGAVEQERKDASHRSRRVDER